MKQRNLATLERELPQIFERRTLQERWRDDVVIVPADLDDPLGDPLQENLGGDLRGGGDWEGSLDGEVGGTAAPLDDDVALDRVYDALVDRFGTDDFPGALKRRPPDVTPPPDCYAFYLPWHEFPPLRWGIYLLVEGIVACGRDLYRLASGGLTPAQARHAAKIFLFHHEAYHNAVETFAARLEVSHRMPCYIRGFRKIYALGGGLPHWVHEESLANAYAAEKVRRYAFSRVVPKSEQDRLRLTAHVALGALFGSMPPPYADSAKILGRFAGRPTYEPYQQGFAERLHEASFAPAIAGRSKEIWDAFGHALHPSLSRNGAFSYVIHRKHPLARAPASVFYFDRRKFLQRLNEECPGDEMNGGRHPHWVVRGGHSVPVPTGDLAHGTARSILKDLGLLSRYKTVKDFMADRPRA